MHGPKCKLGNFCTVGRRIQDVNVLGGLIFPVWGTIEKALSKQVSWPCCLIDIFVMTKKKKEKVIRWKHLVFQFGICCELYFGIWDVVFKILKSPSVVHLFAVPLCAWITLCSQNRKKEKKDTNFYVPGCAFKFHSMWRYTKQAMSLLTIEC